VARERERKSIFHDQNKHNNYTTVNNTGWLPKGPTFIKCWPFIVTIKLWHNYTICKKKEEKIPKTTKKQTKIQ